MSDFDPQEATDAIGEEPVEGQTELPTEPPEKVENGDSAGADEEVDIGE